MEQGQKIFMIGILKGMLSQTTDPDIKYTLEQCAEIISKLAQGYELSEPEKAKESSDEPVIEDIEE